MLKAVKILTLITVLLGVLTASLFNGNAISMEVAVLSMIKIVILFAVNFALMIYLQKKSTQELQLNGRIGK